MEVEEILEKIDAAMGALEGVSRDAIERLEARLDAGEVVSDAAFSIGVHRHRLEAFADAWLALIRVFAPPIVEAEEPEIAGQIQMQG